MLITGGAGYIGSILIPELLKKHRVRVLDNLIYGYYGIIPHLSNTNFEFIRGDIRSNNDLKNSLKNIDFVIHLAAIVGYPACKAKPKLANEVNFLGTRKLVKQSKVPIIFASTGSNYGEIKDVCTEITKQNPQTEYGLTKYKAEKEIKRHSDFIIYRFSTGFGLSLRPRLDLLVNDFLFQAIKNKELIVYEKDYLRSFIHVKDMARSLFFGIDNFNKMNGEIYNIGSENLCITKKDVALKIKKYVDFYLKFAGFGTDPDKRNYKVSFNKIESTGFTSKYNLEFGIQEMIRGFDFIERKENYFNNWVSQCPD